MNSPFRVFIGRMNPIHLGHISTINAMIYDSKKSKNPDHYLIGLGSCNEPTSIKNIFNFSQRLYMLELCGIDTQNVIGIPDFINNDKLWFKNLKQIIKFKGGDINNITFYSGSYADVYYAVEFGCKIRIIDRYTGNKISSSEIKDRLITGSNINDFVHENCVEYIKNEFNEIWKKRYTNFL